MTLTFHSPSCSVVRRGCTMADQLLAGDERWPVSRGKDLQALTRRNDDHRYPVCPKVAADLGSSRIRGRHYLHCPSGLDPRRELGVSRRLVEQRLGSHVEARGRAGLDGELEDALAPEVLPEV